nr:hypothetical protein [uncultured Peptostreptococcus sp.]
MSGEVNKYIKMAIVMSLAVVICILVFTFLPFKELPFIYNEF